MARVPAPVRLFEDIHSEETGAEKWALGILAKGDKKAGTMIYL